MYNRSFLLSIRYFAFIISFLQLLHYLNLGTKPLSFARALARPVENKVLLEVVLVEEIIDCVPKLVFV